MYPSWRLRGALGTGILTLRPSTSSAGCPQSFSADRLNNTTLVPPSMLTTASNDFSSTSPNDNPRGIDPRQERPLPMTGPLARLTSRPGVDVLHRSCTFTYTSRFAAPPSNPRTPGPYRGRPVGGDRSRLQMAHPVTAVGQRASERLVGTTQGGVGIVVIDVERRHSGTHREAGQ